jgi:hypothetical protein
MKKFGLLVILLSFGLFVFACTRPSEKPPKTSPPQAKPEPKPEAKPEPKPEAKPEPKPELKPQPEPEAKPEAKPEPEPEAKPEAKPEPKPGEAGGKDPFGGGIDLPAIEPPIGGTEKPADKPAEEPTPVVPNTEPGSE